VSRQTIFDREDIQGMRGLASLTEPGADEPVGAIVDLAVMGARGDGKTQFIVHAIRTLRAYAPALTGAERDFHRDVLEVVMNAHAPRPEATPPGVVPHYVFRIRPESLLAQIGMLDRLGLYRRAAGLLGHWLLALVNAVVLGAALVALRGGVDAVAVGGAVVALALGAAAGGLVARRRFVQRGVIEIVFWDVAGEHVYRGSAADYYGFLGALVTRRRERSPGGRAYAFAPVLLCNPTALGTRTQGSSYTRLRQILPMFASLNEALPRGLVAINRWAVVDHVCAPDADRDDVVAVAHRPRAPGSEAVAGRTEIRPASGEVDPSALPHLPAVRRDVVRAHCLDAEDGRESELDIAYLRYDAGMQCEIEERPWPGWEALDEEIKAQWQPPAEGAPQRLLDYVYEDGPGAFEGEARRDFLRWLAHLAFHPRSYAPIRADAAAAAPRARDASDLPDGDPGPRPGRAAGPAPAGKPRGKIVDGQLAAAPEGKLAAPPEGKPAVHVDRASESPPRPPVSAADAWIRSADVLQARSGEPGEPGDADAWRPGEGPRPARALSANGLEEFARGAIANALVEDDAAAAGPGGAPGAGPGAGPDGGPRRDKKHDTLPMPGGFGTSGT
jgi:hypothetical protein